MATTHPIPARLILPQEARDAPRARATILTVCLGEVLIQLGLSPITAVLPSILTTITRQ